MDLERDIIFARLVLDRELSHEINTTGSIVVRLKDAKIQFNEIFDPNSNSWDEHGTKMLNTSLHNHRFSITLQRFSEMLRWWSAHWNPQSYYRYILHCLGRVRPAPVRC